MEISILSPRTEIFSGKRDFLKGRPKFRKCAFHLLKFLLVPGLLAWIAFDPTFREKDVVMERAHPRRHFYSGNGSHLPQLSTNRFLRVNGKQPQSVPCFAWAKTIKVKKNMENGKMHKYVCLVMVVRLKEGGKNSG